MARKTKDPVLIALRDQQEKALAAFEKWYSRCKRAFTSMDKAKKKLIRLSKRIEDHLTKSDA